MINSVNLINNSERALKIEDLKALSLANIWIELKDPTKEELEAVSAKSGINAELMKTLGSNDISIRLEPEYAIINFVFVSEIVISKEFHPIIIVFSKDFLITVQTNWDQKIVDLAKARMHKNKADAPSLVAYYFLDEIISDNFLHLEKFEEVTANLEEEILESDDSSTIKKLFSLKSRMISFNKILWYERGILFNLRKSELDCISAKTRGFFDTGHEYLTRQIDIVSTYREVMTDAINLYLSTISNKINSSIKALTVIIFYLSVITTVTSFPNTIATFFGISQFGSTDFRIILVAVIVSTVLPMLWLWRKKWLKAEDQTDPT
jgi:magnesium transporter